MSGLTGKKNSTLVKESVKESKLLTIGVKSLKFWHEAQAAGETNIPFGSLNMPADVSANGEINPTSTEIIAANLALFKNNVDVYSSLNGRLMRGLTYVVQNAQIKFIGDYVTVVDEIFEVSYKNDVVTGNNIVDARPLTATGVLTAGVVDFNVGESFKTNQYPSHQHGEVLVYVDGDLQYRNVANATASPAADGNYQEVHAANGFGVVIRFNNAFFVDKNVSVISRNLIAERPDISMMQLIENLGGQLDTLIEYSAQEFGVDPTIFQTAGNQIDLKAFGDQVYANKINIAANLVSIQAIQLEIQKTQMLGTLENGVQLRQHALTVTGLNWTTDRAVGMPYQTLDGAWRMRFNMKGVMSSTATSFVGTVAGVTFKTVPGANSKQAMSGQLTHGGVADRAVERSYVDSGASTFVIVSLSGLTFNYVYISGDVELDGKPAWL